LAATRGVLHAGAWLLGPTLETTNAQFPKFVAATGCTLAERGGDPKAHVNMPKEFLGLGSVAFIMPTDVKRSGLPTIAPYRPAARAAAGNDLSAAPIGFRTVLNIAEQGRSIKEG